MIPTVFFMFATVLYAEQRHFVMMHEERNGHYETATRFGRYKYLMMDSLVFLMLNVFAFWHILMFVAAKIHIFLYGFL